MAWLGIAFAVVWNYVQHRRGRHTICSTTRWALPPWAFVPAWVVFEVLLVRHIWKGYRTAAGWWRRDW